MGATTHKVVVDEATVTKTYVRWDRGEAEREWSALTLLAEHAAGLAPVPLSRGRSDGRPCLRLSPLRDEVVLVSARHTAR